MKTYKKISIFLSLLFGFHAAFAQVLPVNYAEILVDKKKGDSYKVINLGKNGILTVLESAEYMKGNTELIITNYDTLLNPIWQVKPLIKNDHIIKMYYRENNFMYFLIQKKLTEYDILEFDLTNGNVRIFKLEDIIPLEVNEFKVFNQVIFLGGEVDNRPAVLWFDYLHAKNPKVLPQINTLKADIRTISYSVDGEIVSVLLTSNKSGKPSIYIQNYSLDGHLLNKVEVKPDKSYNLLSFRPYVQNQNEQLIFGTYGHKNSSFAQGFYIAKFENMEQKNIRFYDFSQFKNFFDYLPEKQRNKLYEKIAKKQDKGKTKVHDLNILLSELVKQDDKLLLFADSYTTMTMQSSNYAARNIKPYTTSLPAIAQSWTPQMQTTQNNLVYHYKNAMAIAFDKQGNLLWDNAFEYKDTESLMLTSHIAFNVVKDSIYGLKTQNQDFQYKVMSDAVKNLAIETTKTDTIFNQAKAIDEIEPQIIAWYDTYFLAYGSQNLKTFDKETGTQRKEVFYLTKLYCRKKNESEKNEGEKK